MGMTGFEWLERQNLSLPYALPQTPPDWEFGGFRRLSVSVADTGARGPIIADRLTVSELTFPAWSAAAVFVILPAARLAAWALARRQAARRSRAAAHGRCFDCGYDLRATPGRCPECGAVPAAVGKAR
jgi:hypothetical protein